MPVGVAVGAVPKKQAGPQFRIVPTVRVVLAVFCGVFGDAGSGLPVPYRRTLAKGIHALRSLDASFALGILPPLAANAGSMARAAPSWTVGRPSLKSGTGFSLLSR